MCLIVFAYEQHPVYRLVLGANRDEFLNRPTLPAAPWPEYDGLIAGKDLKAGGTWMGVREGQAFALVTNFRSGFKEIENAPSRGRLPLEFLDGDADPPGFLDVLHDVAHLYNGFNLLVGDAHSIWWYSNRGNAMQRVEPGIHGLSNHLLNTPWPKVTRGKQRLTALLQNPVIDPGAFLDDLRDETLAPYAELPETGVGVAWERKLSPMFINLPEYGTRCSTVLLIDRTGHTEVVERTYPRDGAAPFEVSYRI